MATILVVDDRPDNRSFLVTLLGYSGHQLVEAMDGEEALTKARDHRPDLVITDLLMPTMDGFEFVRRLRSEAALSDVRVIFYTATYLASDARGLADACGVTHILTKPVEPDVVLRVVGEELDREKAPVAPAPLDDFRSEHLRVLNMTLAHKAEVVVPRLNAIIELSVQLASEHNPSRLLATFCAGIRRILGAQYAVLGLVRRAHPEDGQMFSSGLEPAQERSLPATWAPRGALARLVDECRAIRTTADPETLGLPPGLPGAHSLLAAAIHSKGVVYGWISLAASPTGTFTEEEEQLASVLAGLVGRIYENGSRYSAAKRQAEELARSERRFRQLAENIPEVFWVAQVEPFRPLYVSAAYETVWGRPLASFQEKPESWLEAALPADAALAAGFRERMLRGERASEEFRIQRPDGGVRFIWARSFPILNGDGRLERITGICLDVTERRNLDQQIRQSQKMEAVGRLAGGVAHDFNNLLGVVMGCNERALRLLPPDHPSRPKIEQALRATERAVGVTRQLLQFSRKQVISPRVLDLNMVVREMEKMLRTLIGEDVELRVLCGAGLGRIRADAGEIEQILMNLAVNARDAMPLGGRLTIETANDELDGVFVTKHPDVLPGNYVRLVVTDTGSGIAKEIQPNIFEPFFTTKELGRGTGLGLSTVYGIVKQSGGHVFVYSEAGRGAAFRVFLPRVDAPADPVAPLSTAIPEGHETVLLVEDEEMLRGVTREMLELCGYRVLEAANGDEALDLARSFEGTIHLIVTDVIMPGLSGPEIADQVTSDRTAVKVLFVSGYTDDALAHHHVLPTDVSLLQKPFTAGALARKVREVLDGHPPPFHPGH
jgi:PAS domain S-box-containing protein